MGYEINDSIHSFGLELITRPILAVHVNVRYDGMFQISHAHLTSEVMTALKTTSTAMPTFRLQMFLINHA